MSRLALEIRPLTRAAFAPFGDVIETEGAERLVINDGLTERFHDLAAIDVASDGGHPIVNLFRAQPTPLPHRVRMVERHPLGSQAFVPLERAAFLVVVAPKGETVAPGDLHAFRTDGAQGVNYHRGVWHHPVLALERVARFVVIDRGGPGANCDEVHFEATDEIVLAAG